MNLIEVYQWTGIILFVGLIQANLENLILTLRYPAINNFKFKDSTITRPYTNWLSFAFDSPGIWIIYVLKLVLSILLLIQSIQSSIVWYIPLIYMLVELLGFQRQYFLHVSDAPIQRVLLFCISIHYLFQDESISELCLWFISIQVCVVYFTAGFHKLKSAVWQDGSIMTKLLIRSFSNRFSPLLERNVRLCKWLGWSTLGFELVFFISLVGGFINAAILIFGVMFHGFISVGMGINFFFWTFVACYPAVYYVGEQLNQYLF